MAIEIVVPRLGWSMDEGVFVEWLKDDGDRIDEGDPLFTLEGEKAVQDIESIDTGILRIPPEGPRQGDAVTVGMVLAYLVDENEPAPFENETWEPESRIQPNEETSEEFSMPPAATDFSSHKRESPTSGMQTVDVPKRSRLRGLPTISPRAARTATQLGIDWTTLSGSGKNGRIREQDVRSAATLVTSESQHGKPFSVVRKTIADRMLASQQQTAQVTLTSTADATNLVALRAQFKSAPDAFGGLVPSYSEIIVKLTATALSQHPRFNARSSGHEVEMFDQINIGVAVDVDAGLLVPVIRDVGSLSLRQVAEESQRLIERAASRKFSVDELQDGTFTITNLGVYGVDAFTPIINYPECAILGIGRIAKQPTVVDDQIIPRDLVTLSLTFDHRMVDGAPAAQFLHTICERIENPGPWLMP